ncbi:MAG: hypothetical protein MJE77_31000 [Proteobacteria bacterium]|nr:hypothetical protein [Pseudomonadota bacterium]
MQNLFVAAMFLIVGCAGDIADNAIEHDQPTAHIVNNSKSPVEVTVSQSQNCGNASSTIEAAEVRRNYNIAVAGGRDLPSKARSTGQANYLCVENSTVGYPMRPGITYLVGDDNLIVEDASARQE